MKKIYIAPYIEVEPIDDESIMTFSKTSPEGTTPEVPIKDIEVDKGPGSETGDGMNEAKGVSFQWDFDFE